MRDPHCPATLPLSAILAAALADGCSSTSPPTPPPASTCPDILPPACVTPVPSYMTDVAPILAPHCTICHSPTGIAQHDMTTYATVYPQRSSILDWVNDCEMPPLGYPALTLADRTTVLDWFVCEAPDN